MKLATVVGARPQFVKAAALSRALARHNASRLREGLSGVAERLIHTGQHFDEAMSRIFFEEMGLPRPDLNLDIHSLPHGAMVGRMLELLERAFLEDRPDAVLVFGDTNSTLAAALAASKLHIPVAHVEAGLRSFNRRMPEEVNRVLTDHLASFNFCPTPTAVDNLAAEGVVHRPGVCEVRLVGDVMCDAALHYGALAGDRPDLPARLGLAPGSPYFLCTLHRPENTDHPERMDSILSALGRAAGRAPVILPLHPRTRPCLAGRAIPPGIVLIDPVGYLDMLALLKGCAAVLTDSGGLQKEAYFFAKPCVTLRDQTEWTELVRAGCNRVAGADAQAILEALDGLLAARPDFSAPLYGDGRAAQRIADILAEAFGRAEPKEAP